MASILDQITATNTNTASAATPAKQDLVVQAQALLGLGFTTEQVVAMLGAATAPNIAPAPAPALKGFAGATARGEACRLCEAAAGSDACCGVSGPKAVFAAFEAANIPRGGGRLVGLVAAKAAQAADGHSGPVYSRAAKGAAVKAAQAWAALSPSDKAKARAEALARLKG